MLFFFPPPLSVKKKRTYCRKTCSLCVEWVKIPLQLSREMSAGEKNPDSKEKATSFYHFKKERLACDWPQIPPPQTILMLFYHPNMKQNGVPPSASLWPASTWSSFLWVRGVITAFYDIFNALGNRLWTRERREDLSQYWKVESICHMNIIFSCFYDNPALCQKVRVSHYPVPVLSKPW